MPILCGRPILTIFLIRAVLALQIFADIGADSFLRWHIKRVTINEIKIDNEVAIPDQNSPISKEKINIGSNIRLTRVETITDIAI